MANLVITSTTNCIAMDFGVYVGLEGPFGVTQSKATIPKSVIFGVTLAPSSTHVIVSYVGSAALSFLSFNGTAGTRQVDTVNGVAPTSNSDLYDKLSALLG
jgi:hypothetical protein